jgi:ankyrin repeat protein
MFAKDDVHVEAAKGNVENLEALLSRNPELVNLVDRMDNGTPLHWAAVYGQPASCELLLEHGADLKAADERGQTPLFWAIAGNEPTIVELLIEHGADVNCKDADGQSPLKYALSKKQDDTAALLREHGGEDEKHNAAD